MMMARPPAQTRRHGNREVVARYAGTEAISRPQARLPGSWARAWAWVWAWARATPGLGPRLAPFRPVQPGPGLTKPYLCHSGKSFDNQKHKANLLCDAGRFMFTIVANHSECKNP